MKKLKGFTLVELIIVMAIFSGIAVGALAMIRPAMQLFNKTASQEGASADIDNISRYIQDNLKYADRVINCVGFDKFEDIVYTDEYRKSTYDEVNKEVNDEIKSGVPILEFFKDTFIPYARTYKSKDDKTIEPTQIDDKLNVYVMEIDNGSLNLQGGMGKVSIYECKYTQQWETGLDDKVVDKGKYEFSNSPISSTNVNCNSEYSFNINFGNDNIDKDEGLDILGAPNNTPNMFIDIFRNRDTLNSNNEYYDDLMQDITKGKHDSVSAISFINLSQRTTLNVKIGYNKSITYDKDGKPNYNYIIVNNDGVNAFWNCKNTNPVENPKYYIIYTVPEIIIP